jgi:hypothetical protein
MADPELSLQSILITSKVIGRGKALIYVGLVAVFSVTAGMLFGAWVDGVSAWLIGGAMAVGLSVLAMAVYGLSAARNHRRSVGSQAVR